MSRQFYLYVLAIALLLATGRLIDIFLQPLSFTGKGLIYATTRTFEYDSAEVVLRYIKANRFSEKTDTLSGQNTYPGETLSHLKKVSIGPSPIDSAQIKTCLDRKTDWYGWQMRLYDLKLLALPVVCISDSVQKTKP